MKTVPFTYTNEYDAESKVSVNPAFVVSLRPKPGKAKQTIISLASKAEVSVDGELEEVAAKLAGAEPAGAVAVPPEVENKDG